MILIKNLVKYLIIKNKSIFPIFILINILFASCSLENKIAQKKVLNTKLRAVLIGPDFIHKVSLKSDSLTKADSLQIGNLDSLLFYQSDIVQYIEDSIFIKQCLISMQNELILNYNVTLYTSKVPFEKLPDSTFVLKFAEMEMEEFVYRDVETVETEDGHFYDIEFKSDAINVNTWFELTYKTPTNDNFPILYASFFHYPNLLDQVDLTIDEDISIELPNEENLKDVYKSAIDFGKKYASYFYDYMLNIKIYDLMPEGQKPEYFLHYDYKTGKTYPIYDDMFIEIEK